MRIKNLKSGIESIVTKEVWDSMVATKRSMLFRIMEKDDEGIKPKVNIPKEIQEFKINRPERILKTENVVNTPLKSKQK